MMFYNPQHGAVYEKSGTMHNGQLGYLRKKLENVKNVNFRNLNAVDDLKNISDTNFSVEWRIGHTEDGSFQKISVNQV